MADASLVADEVTVEFSGLVALDKVSFHLSPGEILGLIGPNGSGKTTLVNAITGRVPLSHGTISVAGTTISGLKPRQIAHHGVGRSFQIVRLFDNMTVWENIEAAALAKGQSARDAREAAARLSAEFGLERYGDEMAANLSYGDKRRVEIARALAGHPRFLLLDEPAAGMNDAESEILLAALRKLPSAHDLGLLIIDHDMDLITGLCDRLHALASGRTIAQGAVRDVMADAGVIEAYLGAGAAHA